MRSRHLLVLTFMGLVAAGCAARTVPPGQLGEAAGGLTQEAAGVERGLTVTPPDVERLRVRLDAFHTAMLTGDLGTWHSIQSPHARPFPIEEFARDFEEIKAELLAGIAAELEVPPPTLEELARELLAANATPEAPELANATPGPAVLIADVCRCVTLRVPVTAPEHEAVHCAVLVEDAAIPGGPRPPRSVEVWEHVHGEWYSAYKGVGSSCPPGRARGIEQSTGLVDLDDGRYRVGQIWKFRGRPVEQHATLTVVKVESSPLLGVLVHVRFEGVPHMAGMEPRIGYTNVYRYSPFSAIAMDRSVTRLVGTSAELPPFEEGYREWRAAYDGYEGPVHDTSVSDAIHFMELMLGATTEGPARYAPGQ